MNNIDLLQQEIRTIVISVSLSRNISHIINIIRPDVIKYVNHTNILAYVYVELITKNFYLNIYSVQGALIINNTLI